MDEREQLQREVLVELIAYSGKLIPAVQTIIEELRGNEKADTGEFLNEIINGINWEIEVYNQCAALLNSKSNYIDKKTMIAAVTSLGQSISSGDNRKVADCFEQDFLPFLNKLTLAAKMVVE
jgi:hypothetical protein